MKNGDSGSAVSEKLTLGRVVPQTALEGRSGGRTANFCTTQERKHTTEPGNFKGCIYS